MQASWVRAATGVESAPDRGRECPDVASGIQGFEDCPGVGPGAAGTRAGARAQGDRDFETRLRSTGRCPLDVVRSGDQLREPVPAWPSPHLHRT